MAIYNGTTKVSLSGIDKVYVGSTLVWQKISKTLVESLIDGTITELDLTSYPEITKIRSAFNCPNLTRVVMNNNITDIAGGFSNDTALSSVVFSTSLTTIGASAFFNCTSLTSINLPSGLTTIGYNAFYNCTGLTSVTLPSSMTTIGGFSGCTNLTSINIPSSTTEISLEAFYNCTSLASITLPEGLLKLGQRSLVNMPITTLTIPSTVTVVGGSFSCPNLTTITCLATTPPTLQVGFSSSALTEIRVPSASLSDYQSATNWSDYSDIMVGV